MSYTTVEKVAEYARNLEVKYGQNSTITPQDVQVYVDDADTLVNGRLSHAYYVPLQQITRNNIAKYPDPIPFIATKIAAAMAVRAIYSRIDPQTSASAEQHLNDSLRELNRYTEGTFQGTHRLEGQTLKARNSFINPYIAPLDAPNKQGTI